MEKLLKVKAMRSLLISIFAPIISLALTLSIWQVASANNLTLPAPNNPQSNSTGLVGEIPSPPPSTSATILTPTNNQVFTSEPVIVSGLCPSGLLIELFDNNVFTGAVMCGSKSYSITTYLFNGLNSLVAEDFDSLNQEGPVSNTVSVDFNNPTLALAPGISLTSNYAKLGQDPGVSLTWPVELSNGNAPYAISVNWGDNTPNQLVSDPTPGKLNISHTYAIAGVYTILIQVTDTTGNTAYLQLVAVSNGKINQAAASSASNKTAAFTGVKLSDATIWVLAGVAVLLTPAGFWLGYHHQLQIVKRRLEKGERPFI